MPCRRQLSSLMIPMTLLTASIKYLPDFLDSQVPVKQKRVKNKAQSKLFTTEIDEHIKKRDGLLKKARISGSPDDWATF